MKACAAFEDRLVDYRDLPSRDRREVDEHLKGCAACRQYLAVLQEIDSALAAQVRQIRIDPRRYAAVRRQTSVAMPMSKASRLPEWLDFVAASAVCAFSYALAWQTGLFAYLAAAVGR